MRPIRRRNETLRDVGDHSTFLLARHRLVCSILMADTTVLIPSEEKKDQKNSTYWIYLSSLVISLIAIIIGISGFMKKVTVRALTDL